MVGISSTVIFQPLVVSTLIVFKTAPSAPSKRIVHTPPGTEEVKRYINFSFPSRLTCFNLADDAFRIANHFVSFNAQFTNKSAKSELMEGCQVFKKR